MSSITAVTVAAMLLLTACSDSSAGKDTGKPKQQTALEGVTPERLCELLPSDAVEEALGVVVKETRGRESGRPPILTKTCRYSLEFELMEVDVLPPAVVTNVGQTRDKSVGEVLDNAFTDMVSENETVGAYDKVDWLGDGAGYGDYPHHGGATNESLLVIVFTAGDERFRFELQVSPRTPFEKLEPLATEMLTGLEGELG